MPARRLNPNCVKQHRSYTVEELASCLKVHKNTVRNWQARGLDPIDRVRPVLFQGGEVREYLAKQNVTRKQPCPPGKFYCFRCRCPRRPALGMVDYVPMRPTSGNLRALCEQCETMMHRRARYADIAKIMPGCSVQIGEGQASLVGQTTPSLNCDSRRTG